MPRTLIRNRRPKPVGRQPNPVGEKGPNKWTIMFFFAMDHELSPHNVSQIKGLMDAGYHKETEVLLYFDSNAKAVPTRLFNVNHSRKRTPPTSMSGDGADPYVRNFVKDQIRPYKIDRHKGKYSASLRKALSGTDRMNASEALENFIGYCLENHRADHYLLFLVGHGLAVGNDSFLFDENPRSGISLKDFGKIMNTFAASFGDRLELLALHSCSMSAIEVAYEIKGTANYLIASEGLSFVGSWPYRQLLKKIFNTTESTNLSKQDLRTLVESLYDLSLYNAVDFAFTGYSHDLNLISLSGDKVAEFMIPLQVLTKRLKEALDSPRGEQLISLAHLKSQSYWKEEYTDIYDFCRCLSDLCDPNVKNEGELQKACNNVIQKLQQSSDGLVVFSDNFGWEYQYSHGLSIYFPWSVPVDDLRTTPLAVYRSYKFNRDFRNKDQDNSWASFLKKYWDKTMRQPENAAPSKFFDLIMQPKTSTLFGAYSKPGGSYNKPGGGYNKPGGSFTDAMCICPSIKNFSTTVKLNRRVKEFSMTEKVERAVRQNQPQ